MPKEQMLIAQQDENGKEFIEGVNFYLSDGWRIIPGTIGFATVEIPKRFAGITTPVDYRKVVMGWCVIERES